MYNILLDNFEHFLKSPSFREFLSLLNSSGLEINTFSWSKIHPLHLSISTCMLSFCSFNSAVIKSKLSVTLCNDS